jgi:hypothetical protein
MLNSSSSLPTEYLDPQEVLKAVAEGGRLARLSHRQTGHPIVIWRDGKTVVVPPEEIEP